MKELGLIAHFSEPLWLWLMLASLSFWAIRLLIDEYLTMDGNEMESIYKESIYGTVISGRFAGYVSIPLIMAHYLIVQVDVSLIDIILLLFSGAFFLLHYHFFFILLKNHTDTNAAWTESISSGHLVLTPCLLFLLVGERFNLIVMIGIIIVALSLLAVFLRTKDIVIRNLGAVSCFILSFSLSTVFSDLAYEGHDDLWMVICLLGFFYLGMALCGQAFYLSIKNKIKRQEINQTIKSHFGFLSFAELIDLSGSFFFQMAIAAAPTVVFVAAMLQFLPIACMLYAIVFLVVSTNQQTRMVARSQLKEGVVKTAASIFTFVGAVLIIASAQVEEYLKYYFTGN